MNTYLLLKRFFNGENLSSQEVLHLYDNNKNPWVIELLAEEIAIKYCGIKGVELVDLIKDLIVKGYTEQNIIDKLVALLQAHIKGLTILKEE